MIDKVQTIEEYFDSILRGTITLNYGLGDLRQKFMTDLEKWNDLRKTKPDSPEFDELNNSLFSTILAWRSEHDLFRKGDTDIRTDYKIAKLEQELNELKNDMKNVVKKLKELNEKLTPEESLEQESMKFDAVR